MSKLNVNLRKPGKSRFFCFFLDFFVQLKIWLTKCIIDSKMTLLFVSFIEIAQKIKKIQYKFYINIFCSSQWVSMKYPLQK